MNAQTPGDDELNRVMKEATLEHFESKWNNKRPLTPVQKEMMIQFADACTLLLPFCAAMLRAENVRFEFSISMMPVVLHHQQLTASEAAEMQSWQVIRQACRALPDKDRQYILRIADVKHWHIAGGIEYVMSEGLIEDLISIQGLVVDCREGFPFALFRRSAIYQFAITYLYCLDVQSIMSFNAGRGQKIQRFYKFYPTKAINEIIIGTFQNQLKLLYRMRADGYEINYSKNREHFATALEGYKASAT